MTIHRNMYADAMQLQEEFPVETAFLVDLIKAYIYAIRQNFMYNKNSWTRDKKLFDFTVWISFIDLIERRIKEQEVEIKTNPQVFARLLFGDGSRIFTLHCLFTLTLAIKENERFNNKVIELFSPKTK